MNQEDIERQLSDVLGCRMARPFELMDIMTVGDLIRAIQVSGIVRRGSEVSFANFCLQDRVRGHIGPGKKTWALLLALLDELGFDWKRHLVGRFYQDEASADWRRASAYRDVLATASIADDQTVEMIHEMIRLFTALPPEDRRALLRVARALVVPDVGKCHERH